MKYRVLIGGALLVFSVVRLLLLLVDFDASSYGVGQLTGVLLVGLLGVWLIRSGRREQRT